MSTTQVPALPLRWLTRPRAHGVTWGVPWQRGVLRDPGVLELATATGAAPLQSWTLATWPDGSVKWSAHATTALTDPAPVLRPRAGNAAAAVDGATQAHQPTGGHDVEHPAPAITLTSQPDEFVLDTGVARWRIAHAGTDLLRGAQALAPEGHWTDVAGTTELVAYSQDGPADDLNPPARHVWRGHVESATVEQQGPVRAVVLLVGHYRREDAPGQALPFRVRLVAHAGDHELRVVHTLILDADPLPLHLAGIGLRAAVPLSDAPYDRHVRLAGTQREDGTFGFFSEAVQGLTGLRRDPGEEIRANQVAGRSVGEPERWEPRVSTRLHWVPRWSDWRQEQHSPDGYTLAKRVDAGGAWVPAPGGRRAGGLAYLGGVSGGLAVAIRDFWRSYPTRLDISGATQDTGHVTAWLWSPSAPAMDLRPYHDGLGQQDFADQLDALEITYEDWEEEYNTPRGIARTHQLSLLAYPATPEQGELSADLEAVQDPALLQASPADIHRAGVFGDWSLPDRTTPARAAIEDNLDFLREFYLTEQEQRRWYGFWDYGDVMHTYDPDRHQWRYDVGGYAWDNSELSTDLWLWYDALRTGEARSFRFAEAMTRHTGEVDVYHSGPWAGLGTRHNVQHWGCSAKQLRISSAIYRRFLYYLTADERIGELLAETADSERALLAIDATRKVREDVYSPDPNRLAVGLGTDWGALLSGWLTAWERTGSDRYRDKVLGTMRDVGELAQGFFTGEALLDLDTGRFDTERVRVMVSHLSSVFGLVEICAELIAMTKGTQWEVPGFEEAWLRYCRLYLAGPQAHTAEFGKPLKGISLVQAHSRLTAYAARASGQEELARAAVRAFRRDENDQLNTNALQREEDWTRTRVAGPEVSEVVQEAPFVSTNDAAQYGLTAIQLLELIPEFLDQEPR